MNHIDEITALFKTSAELKIDFVSKEAGKINWLVDILTKMFTMGNKLILFGNGGSSADASHIAAEFINRFKINRKGLPAIALNTDVAVITSIANDFEYADLFVRQLDPLLHENDMVFAFSTSGNSENVIRAVELARAKGAFTVGFTGASGGRLIDVSDVIFAVPSSDTARIQECYMTLCHVICGIVERELFGDHK